MNMKDYAKFHNPLQKINLQDDASVFAALRKAKLYSKENIFPIASLQFELTAHCNMFCKHCYNNSGTANGVADAMTPERWLAFAKYLVDKGGVFECLLSGGEPLLLGDKLFEIMDVFHEDGSLFMLLTNGYFLTREKARRLKKYRYHWLQISIDGADAEYHDSFRGLKGSWQKAVDAARFVAENGIPLKIAHCVTPYNLNAVDEMCALALSIGASSIIAGELCLSGRVAQNQDLLLSEAQRKILRQKVAENRARYEGRMIVKTSNSVRAGLERHFKSPRAAAVIRPNGDVRIDGMAPFVIGNILADDFVEVWTRKADAWQTNRRVAEFIGNFDATDRNYSFVNYRDEDIRI